MDETCRDFAFVGANAWRVLEAQAGVIDEKVDGVNPTEWMMKTAAANNVSVIRMFASSVTPDLILQTGPDSYNEKALQALDQTVALAGKYGIRLTLIFVDTWKTPESITNFAAWSGTSISDFFTNSKVINMFKDHMTYMVTRTNTVTGVKYSEDPTIFSWNIANEPRFQYNYTTCQSNPQQCGNDMNNWIKETSAHLKSVDPNHMVTVGYEGFFGDGSQYLGSNPSTGWPEYTGQEFDVNGAIPDIDYVGAFSFSFEIIKFVYIPVVHKLYSTSISSTAEIHLWVDNWGASGGSGFVDQWINTHKEVAKSLGKPLVMEEFGKHVANPFDDNSNDANLREQTFSRVLSALQDSLSTGDVLRGALYWMWDPSLQSTSSPGYDRYGGDQVPITSSLFQNTIAPVAAKAASMKNTAQGCLQPAIAAAGRKLLSETK